MGLQGLWVSTAAVERREEGACTGNLFCFSLHGRAKRKSDMAERRASCMYISGEEQALVKVEPKGRYDCSCCDCALAHCQILKGYIYLWGSNPAQALVTM